MRITIKRQTDSPLRDRLVRYIAAKKAADQAAHELADAADQLTEALEKEGRKSTSLIEGDKVMKATFKQNTSVTIDEVGLKKAVGAKVWPHITTAKVDRTKLETAIDKGEIPAETVGQYLTTKQSKAYIQYTESVRKQDQEADPDE